MATQPSVLWAQRSSETDGTQNYIFLNVVLPNIKESSLIVEIFPAEISFRAFAGNPPAGIPEKEYCFTINFLSKIIPQNVVRRLTPSSFSLALPKAVLLGDHWPCLSRDEGRMAFLHRDPDLYLSKEQQTPTQPLLYKIPCRGRSAGGWEFLLPEVVHTRLDLRWTQRTSSKKIDKNAIFISADFPEEIDRDWDVDVTKSTVSMKVQAARVNNGIKRIFEIDLTLFSEVIVSKSLYRLTGGGEKVEFILPKANPGQEWPFLTASDGGDAAYIKPRAPVLVFADEGSGKNINLEDDDRPRGTVAYAPYGQVYIKSCIGKPTLVYAEGMDVDDLDGWSGFMAFGTGIKPRKVSHRLMSGDNYQIPNPSPEELADPEQWQLWGSDPSHRNQNPHSPMSPRFPTYASMPPPLAGRDSEVFSRGRNTSLRPNHGGTSPLKHDTDVPVKISASTLPSKQTRRRPPQAIDVALANGSSDRVLESVPTPRLPSTGSNSSVEIDSDSNRKKARRWKSLLTLFTSGAKVNNAHL